MNTKTLLLALGILAITHCTSQKTVTIKGFDNPPSIELGSEKEHALEDLLYEGLKNIRSLGIFDSHFVQSLDNAQFMLVYGNNLDYGGFYKKVHQGNPVIAVAVDEEFNKRFRKEYPFSLDKEDLENTLNKYIKSGIMITLTHEIQHHYWFTQMSESQRKGFTDVIIQKKALIDAISPRLASCDSEAEKESILTSYNIHPRFYDNFNRFMGHKKYYQKLYGNSFEERFYGSEAFSLLMDDVLFEKALLKANAISNSYGNAGFEILMRENAYRKSVQWDELPKELLEFYRGCINNYFFQEYDPKYWDSEKNAPVSPK